MKIFTIDNIRAIERATIDSQQVAEREMVGRVSERVSAEVSQRWRPSKPTVIFAGPGYNGAYALDTARLLMQQGFHPQIFLFNISGMNAGPLGRLCRDELLKEFPKADFTEVVRDFHVPELSSASLVIDGLFGAGLRAPLEGGFQALVRYINESHATVVSIDLPSGLFPDWNPQAISRNIVHANLTLAIQFPHPAFFFSENSEMVGKWKTIDVGMSPDAVNAAVTPFHMVELPELAHLLKPRPDFCSKADFGHVLLAGGSQGMMGAITFSALAALRAGAGKVTMHVPQCGLDIAQIRIPEALCRIDTGRAVITDIPLSIPYDAIGVGPGMGTANSTFAAFEKLVKCAEKPLVIDADALNCIAQSPELLNHLPRHSVITPHAGEFDRIFGAHNGDEARLHKAIDMSRHYNILIILKGHNTALVRPDGKVYFNSTGSPALATPGSGDVLTGIIAALLAQDYKPEISALLGVFIHGKAGELAAARQGQYGVLASDIIDAIGPAIKDLMKM